MTNGLVKERRDGRDRPREGGHMQTEIREMQLPEGQGHQELWAAPPEAERGLEQTQTLPRCLQKEPALRTVRGHGPVALCHPVCGNG